MGNLGRYEVITTEAKLAGGVNAWLKAIEDTAVAERSPAYLAMGAVIGVVLTSTVAGTAYVVHAARIRRRQQRDVPGEARRRLDGYVARYQGMGSDADEPPSSEMDPIR